MSEEMKDAQPAEAQAQSPADAEKVAPVIPPPTQESAPSAKMATEAPAAPQENTEVSESPAAARPRTRLLATIGGVILAVLVAMYFIDRRRERDSMRSLTHLQQVISQLERSALALQDSSRSSIVSRPSDFAVMMDRGKVFLKARRLQEALQAFNSALVADPANPSADEAHYSIGLCHLRLGGMQPALQAFRNLTTDFPSSRYAPHGWLEIARIHMERLEFSVARGALYKIIAMRDSGDRDSQAVTAQAGYMLASCYDAEADEIEKNRGIAVLPAAVEEAK